MLGVHAGWGCRVQAPWCWAALVRGGGNISVDGVLVGAPYPKPTFHALLALTAARGVQRRPGCGSGPAGRNERCAGVGWTCHVAVTTPPSPWRWPSRGAGAWHVTVGQVWPDPPTRAPASHPAAPTRRHVAPWRTMGWAHCQHPHQERKCHLSHYLEYEITILLYSSPCGSAVAYTQLWNEVKLPSPFTLTLQRLEDRRIEYNRPMTLNTMSRVLKKLRWLHCLKNYISFLNSRFLLIMPMLGAVRRVCEVVRSMWSRPEAEVGGPSPTLVPHRLFPQLPTRFPFYTADWLHCESQSRPPRGTVALRAVLVVGRSRPLGLGHQRPSARQPRGCRGWGGTLTHD